MRKWLSDIYLGVAVLSVVMPILFLLDNQRTALLERQAGADASVLERCTAIAAQARGPNFGSVKEQCLLSFDQRYAGRKAVQGH